MVIKSRLMGLVYMFAALVLLVAAVVAGQSGNVGLAVAGAAMFTVFYHKGDALLELANRLEAQLSLWSEPKEKTKEKTNGV